MSQAAKLGPLSGDQKDYLFTHVLRCPAIFSKARTYLTAADMDPVRDVPYIVLWQAALTVAERTDGILPPAEQLRTLVEIEAKLLADQDPYTVKDEHRNAIFGGDRTLGLIDYVFEFEEPALDPDHGELFLQAYLEERTVKEAIRQYAAVGHREKSVADFVQDLAQSRAAVASLTQDPATIPFPEGVELPSPEIVTTGLGFLDYYMGGGQAKGEVYTIIGPTGSGKSTIAMEIAYHGALWQQDHNPVQPEHWYYFNYECPVKPDLLRRLWACSAEIEEDSLRKMRHSEDYGVLSSSTRRDWRDYERQRFAHLFGQGGQPPAGELERLLNAKARLQPSEDKCNLWLVDFSGEKECRGAGWGGYQEIAAYMENQVLKGRQPFGIIVDYAGLVTKRQAARMKDNYRDRQYEFLSSFVDDLRTSIASRFNCCIWILGQLKGDESDRSPTAKLHHSSAAGCRNLSDNSWFGFVIGNKTNDHLFKIECTKQRRASQRPPSVIYLDGAVRRCEGRADEYAINHLTRSFVPKAYEEKVIDISTTASSRLTRMLDPAS